MIKCEAIPGNRGLGKLEVNVLCSAEPCKIPQLPAHGTVGNCPADMTLKSGQSCTPGCQVGYSHEGNNPGRISCNLGKMSGVPSQCLKDCDAAAFSSKLPQNGKSVKCPSTVRSGEKCPFECTSGFIAGGSLSCDNGAVHSNARCNRACSDSSEGQCTCVSAGCVAVSSCDKSSCDFQACQTFFPDKFKGSGTATCKGAPSHHHSKNQNTNDATVCKAIGITNGKECSLHCSSGTSKVSCTNGDCRCECNGEVVCRKSSSGIGAGVWILIFVFGIVGSTLGYVWWKKRNGEALPAFLQKLPFIGDRRNDEALSYRPI